VAGGPALAGARSPERQAERVKRLLAGEPVDPVPLAYPMEGWHVGVLAGRLDAEEALRELAAALGCALLIVCPDEERIWAWLGGARRPDPAVALRALAEMPGARPTVALGEPAENLAGWRLSHRQALAAMPVAARLPSRRARYAEVALLAAALGDELLGESLRRAYLAPLEREHEDGLTLRHTLAAYFATAHNVSSAAARLGVSRNTVSTRLRSVEEKIGRPLHTCTAELETALRLRELGES
jgi:hypothetical protein